MGQVFLGRSPGGRPVAVKVIRAELLAGSPDFRARFAREVEAARRVNALFTAPVVDADPDADVPWLVTAYVPGPSLADAVEDHGPLGAGVIRALAAGLAEGLAAIHAAGVVHRDLKPSNVLLASDGPRIIDFGISRAAEASALTATGAFVGSPSFMSPEQASGDPIGPPSDVFSLGSVLTFAATGQGPFQATSVPALFFQVVNAEPVLTGVPPVLRPLLERCLARNPPDRPTPQQIIEELGHVGLLHNWLPEAVAATLVRYDLQNADRDLPRPAPRPPAEASDLSTAAAPQAPPRQRAYLPPPALPIQAQAQLQTQARANAPRRTRRPASGYQPPPAVQPRVGRPTAQALPPAYRFGWLGLPILLFLAVAAFVAPLETLYSLTAGFVVTLAVSRPVGAVLRVRARGMPGFGELALRSVLGDIAGSIGLVLLGFASLLVTVDVLLPAIGPGNPRDYRAALNVAGPANPFTSPAQAGYFLHLFLPLPVLVVAAVVLMRTRANLSRPLVLPRLARMANRQPGLIRLAVAAAVTALAGVLIALNGGLAPSRLPSGGICVIAPATCASAAKLHAKA